MSKDHVFRDLNNEELEGLLKPSGENKAVIPAEITISNLFWTKQSFCTDANWEKEEYINDAPLLKKVLEAASEGKIPSFIIQDSDKNEKQKGAFGRWKDELDAKYPKAKEIEADFGQSVRPITEKTIRVDEKDSSMGGWMYYAPSLSGLASGIAPLWSYLWPTTVASPKQRDDKEVPLDTIKNEKAVDSKVDQKSTEYKIEKRQRPQQPLPTHAAQVSAEKKDSVMERS